MVLLDFTLSKSFWKGFQNKIDIVISAATVIIFSGEFSLSLYTHVLWGERIYSVIPVAVPLSFMGLLSDTCVGNAENVFPATDFKGDR